MGGPAEAVLEAAADGVSGGTVLDKALRWALLQGAAGSEDEQRPDLVLVTDGMAETVGNHVATCLKAARKDWDLRVFGLVINGGTLTPVLKQLCDEHCNLAATRDVGSSAAVAVKL